MAISRSIDDSAPATWTGPFRPRAMVAWWRGLRLDLQFGITAAVVIFLGMAVLGTWVSDRIARAVVQNSAANTALYLVGFVEPHVQDLAHSDELTPRARENLSALLQRSLLGGRVVAIKVWGQGGRIVYSSDNRHVDQVFPETDHLRRAWAGHIEPEYNDLDDVENEIERQLNKPMLEIYVPVRDAQTNEVIAVAEIYEVAEDLAADLRTAYLETIFIVASLSVAMLASLFHIVWRGSRTIAEQKVALNERISELSRLLEENRSLQANVARANRKAAQTNEQFLRRIGAELHDGPAQLIALGLLRLDAVKRRLKATEANRRDDFPIIRDALGDALQEIRAICAGIAIPELKNATLTETLRIAVKNHESRTNSSVAAEFGDNLPATLTLPIHTCLFRFVQEGLNNAAKHADGIGQRVVASYENGSLELQVSDNGPGFDPDLETIDAKPTGGIGLTGLMNRIESMGGVFKISSVPGEGATLIAQFNVEELGLKND